MLTKRPAYHELLEYISQLTAINCHTHHLRDEAFAGFGLLSLLGNSYTQWSALWPGDSFEERTAFLNLVRTKSFFRVLEMGIMRVYDMDVPITAQTWALYDEKIQSAHQKNPKLHLELLRTHGRYETSILDAYWHPGSDNGHPEYFTPTFRIGSLFFPFGPEDGDHNSTGAWGFLGWRGGSLTAYLDFTREALQKAKVNGACALKNALPYDRGIDYQNPTKAQAEQAFSKRNPTAEEKLLFQDYLFHQIAEMASELDMTLQCHTGTGQRGKTRPLHMLDFLRAHQKTRFSLMHGGYPWTEDILSFFDCLPNVYSDVCWLPLLSPTAARAVLHQTIEAATSDRILWGCDTWTGEESVGARIAMDEALAAVLAEKVESRYMGMGDARYLAERIMYHNGKALFGV